MGVSPTGLKEEKKLPLHEQRGIFGYWRRMKKIPEG